MSAASVICVDIGSTGAKVAVVEASGRISAPGYRGYTTRASGARVEQDPEEWWAAVAALLRELAREIAVSSPSMRPDAIVIGGQMQDLILAGGGSRQPAILYSDTRAQAEAREVAAWRGLERHSAEARNDQDATGLAAKLLWVSRNTREAAARAEHLFFGAHDYATFRLCGAATTDLTTASTTGLLLFDEGLWNLRLLSSLGLRTDWLPLLGPAGEEVGRISLAAAAETGLPEGLPVLRGAGDAATATLGSRAGEEGRLSINLGTSGWVAMTSRGGPADPATGAFNLRHPDGERLILVGPVATAAGNYDWFRSALFPGAERETAFETMNREAEAAVAGSGALLYLPWLSGERSPFRDPEARAAFIGLSREMGRGELCRATMEGVAFSLRSVHRALGGRGGSIAQATAVGGGARSPLWCRILASALGCEVSVPERPEEAGLRGAAILAGRTLGWFSSCDPGPAFFPLASTWKPEVSWARAYEELAVIYEELHEALKPTFAALARARKPATTAGAGTIT
jgi:xylulokinase